MKAPMKKLLFCGLTFISALVIGSNASAGGSNLVIGFTAPAGGPYHLNCNESMCVEHCCVEVDCEGDGISGDLWFEFVGENYYADYDFRYGEAWICSASATVCTDMSPTTEYICERDDDDDGGELEIEIEFDCEDD